SVSVTVRLAVPLGASAPNESPVGAAKRSGTSARGRSITPPPVRATGTPATGSPVCTSADLTCATVQSGCRSLSSAAAPATCGAAMLVPLRSPHGPPSFDGSDEITSTPGAATSGFISSESGVGPADEKSAIELRDVTAATVIASGALAGDDTLP